MLARNRPRARALAYGVPRSRRAIVAALADRHDIACTRAPACASRSRLLVEQAAVPPPLVDGSSRG